MPIKRKNEQTLGEAIDQMIDAYRMGPRMDEHRLITEWEQIVGKTIAKHTCNLRLKGSTLIMYCDSSTLKQEIIFSRSAMMQLINQAMGKNIIDQIIVR